jgi:hypothetical protein
MAQNIFASASAAAAASDAKLNATSNPYAQRRALRLRPFCLYNNFHEN